MTTNTLTIQDINLNTWFSDREVDILPKHFVKATTPVTQEAVSWVLQNLIGRFSITVSLDEFQLIRIRYIWFEDPKEAMMYELKWS